MSASSAPQLWSIVLAIAAGQPGGLRQRMNRRSNTSRSQVRSTPDLLEETGFMEQDPGYRTTESTECLELEEMTNPHGSWSPPPVSKIVVPVANMTADDCMKLAGLFDATAEVLQPRITDGHAEARVGFLRMLSAALRESSHDLRQDASELRAAEDASEFYGDGDPDTSS
jgi:hypothetical protein